MLSVVAVLVVVAVVLAVTNGFSSSTRQPTSSTTATVGKTPAIKGATAKALAPAKAQAIADTRAEGEHCPSKLRDRVNDLHWTLPPALSIDPTKTYTATVDTSGGAFVVQLDPKNAPQAVNSFVFLAQQGFYTCVAFDQAVPGEFAATGDPTGTTDGGPGYTIPAENVPSSYTAGDMVMTKSAAGTSGSQFLVDIQKGQTAIPEGSSVLGKVTSGFFVLQGIAYYGNPSPSKDGRTPKVIYRILKVTVTTTAG